MSHNNNAGAPTSLPSIEPTVKTKEIKGSGRTGNTFSRKTAAEEWEVHFAHDKFFLAPTAEFRPCLAVNNRDQEQSDKPEYTSPCISR